MRPRARQPDMTSGCVGDLTKHFDAVSHPSDKDPTSSRRPRVTPIWWTNPLLRDSLERRIPPGALECEPAVGVSCSFFQKNYVPTPPACDTILQLAPVLSWIDRVESKNPPA